MSTDTKVTVTGWVGTQPKHFVSEIGTDFTSFRLASTKRFYNRAEDAWVDGLTTWFTVKAWRSMAVNIAESLRKSDPVVVHGTLTSETWESPDGPRTTIVIEADAVGPDLARGQATFRHTVHTKAGEAPPASDGGPTDPWAVNGTDSAAEPAPDAGAEEGADEAQDGELVSADDRTVA
ncbi:single-strand DNA-binding protein [Sanguibacter gelidistatuariae]|uniref:Single-strand DNA-binding protein n=1 Tax=Sanguibacter gelidistatuariae TaxID=1814289 RepID=A0A1G6N853_9MICO|nr:single-stranded DNA-binding protein [Sanguibacter gelidistatuariae]SDC63325.1 single-strand DNA-binding protein [Sanguibacter gelidistatuariae]